MQEIDFEEAVDQIVAKDPRYHRDAYLFLRAALDETQKQVARESKGKVRHVSGPELLRGIREYALREFGPLTLIVFEEWGVRSTADFGEIVFNLVDSGQLAKTDSDTRADFADVYDFSEAFRKPFLPSAKQAAPQPQPKPARA